MTTPARQPLIVLAIWCLVLTSTSWAQSWTEAHPSNVAIDLGASRIQLPPDTPFLPRAASPNMGQDRAAVPALPAATERSSIVEIPPPARRQRGPMQLASASPPVPVTIPISIPIPAPATIPVAATMPVAVAVPVQVASPQVPLVGQPMSTGLNTVPGMTPSHSAPITNAPPNTPMAAAVPNQFMPESGLMMPPGGVGVGAGSAAGGAGFDPNCLAPCAMSGMGIRPVTFSPESFLPAPLSTAPYNPAEELATYRQKYSVPVQRPWVEFWRPFYTPGIYPPANDFFGKTNLLFPHFYVYGDYRTGLGINRNQAGNARSWAHRLNLDMDLGLTATERIHGFMGPLDNGAQFTRLDFSDNAQFEFETDARFDTLYFEGDVGAIAGGLAGIDSPFDLPFTFGLVPLLYQNGIWMEDAVLGAAFAIPARHSRELHWSNFDATFFAVGDQLTSDAFQGSNSAAEALGTAWFIDAYDGYIELDYAYVHDDVGQQRSYNNFAVAFTRRYFMTLSNSVRLITNFGQDLPEAQRTADGYLILVENSLISPLPNTLVPYCNLWYGSGRPQSVARAGGSGGILRNTGINFETDGLTGYPTLDPTAANTYGAAVGLNALGPNYRDQLVVEAAALGSYGSSAFRRVAGDQYAVGVRYQRPLSHRWIFRTDTMFGFLRKAEDIYGNRIEFRWKF